MEIEKTLSLDAPPARVWALLLDPNAMGACVPGMESIEVVSDSEYVAVMKVKISFISARFKLKTRIVERDETRYLRAEGTGEDTSVASSLKQVSEMWLAERDGGGTELRMKVKVDVLGRMGTFGLGVMKTKADRLWDEFGVNAAARLAGADRPAVPAAAAPVPAQVPAPEVPAATAATQAAAPAPVAAAPAAPLSVPAGATQVPAPGFWARLFGARQDIRVEVQRGDTRIVVSWPVQAAPECAAWLRSLV
ncbi:CoxG family protein [Hydrogenophaga atypica]|uniref:CoxG family protein n=1 Tax=Hydrogenophaga atypica TaxID=249409 RepID=A0ABW2QNN7_9BURK